MEENLKSMLENETKVSVGDNPEIQYNGVYFPTGIDMLNLILSGTCYKGLKAGVLELQAESGVGKSLFAVNLMKTCIESGDFDDYRFLYVDKESSAAGFPLPQGVRDRIEFFDATNTNVNLSTIERAFLSILNWLEEGKPCVIVLDSINAFISEAIKDSVEKNQKTVESSKESDLAESRMASVAQATSKYMPLISEKLKQTNSLLVFISQFRDNMTVGGNPQYTSFLDQRRTSGGRALKYYGDYRLVFRQGKVLKKAVSTGRELVQGYEVHIDADKNRGSGARATCTVAFRGSHLQIGNVGAMFTYLVDTGRIKRKGAYCSVDWYNEGRNAFEKDMKKAIKESPELLDRLRHECDLVWKEEQDDLNVGVF